MTIIANDTEFGPALNSGEFIPAAELNRRIAERVNEIGTWEALQLRTADWCVTHPLLTAVIATAVLAASVVASALFPFPWGMMK